MKKKFLILTLLFAVAAVMVVKFWFFPPVKDDYFAMDPRSLQKVPAGLMVVRPTHFAFLKEKGILRTESPSGGKDRLWQMGRNVPLRDVVAAGYDWHPGRIVLPPDAPTGRFDFLMTGTTNQLADFQALIRRKLGYVAQKESRDGEVLALKIANPALPALTISGPNEKRGIQFRKEKLYFTRMPLSVIPGIFGNLLEKPLVDKTGTTNFYNFTIDWNSKTDQGYEEKSMTPERVDQIIGALGLKFEPDTAPMEMLVVKKAN
jgi:uncharacterized protein (TIGR03435 family)